MTEIKIETDVFQTWQFDFTYLKSFVERKHVTDDTRGKHTILENLEFGEYVNNFAYHYTLGSTQTESYYYLVQVDKLKDGTEKLFTPYGGIPQAGRCLHL